MRVGHEYLVVKKEAEAPTSVASTPDEHFSENDYGRPRPCQNPDEFLQSDLFSPWVLEAHECYREALKGSERVLSIGAGLGEHDVLLFRAGYNLVTTDVIPGIHQLAQSLFPAMTFGTLDVLDPNSIDRYRCDAVLVTGLDYALDEARAGQALNTWPGC